MAFGRKMKRKMAKINTPLAVDECSKEIDNMYRDKLNEEIPRAVILGGFTVYEILYEQFVEPINKANGKEETSKAIVDLIAKITTEYQNVQKQKGKKL